MQKDIPCKDFESNDYMIGLHNGLEIAISEFEIRDPECIDIPGKTNTKDIFHTGTDKYNLFT